MLSILPRQAFCLVIALNSVAPAVLPAQQKAQSIKASAMTAEQEEELLKHLRQNHKPAIDFVVGKFAKHDVVMLGETHQVAENCKFVQSLIGPLYGRDVRLMIWEFTRSRQDKDLNRLLIADKFDQALAAAIFRDHPWATWGYKDYVDVLPRSGNSIARYLGTRPIFESSEWMKAPGRSTVSGSMARHPQRPFST